MAVSFVELQTSQGEMFTSSRRIFLNADRSRAVDADDPAACFLLVGEGSQIPMGEALRYGLVGDRPMPAAPAAIEPEPEVSDEPEPVGSKFKAVRPKGRAK